MIVAATLVVVAATATVVASRSRSGPSVPLMRFQGEKGDKFGIAAIYNPGRLSTFGSIPLCLTKPGAATIISVVPRGGGGGLNITAFAVRPGTAGSGFGAGHRSLQAEGFPTTAIVSTICGSVSADELGLTVQRTGDGNGQYTSLRVNYQVAGKHLSAVIPMGLKICGPDGRTTETCGDAFS